MLGNFRGITFQAAGIQLCASFFQHRIAQHFDQPLPPVLDVLLKGQVLFLKIRLVARNRFRQFLGSHAVAGDGLYDWRSPAVAAGCQRLHGPNLALDALSAFAVALVDDEDVGDFHDSRLYRLHIIAHARHENHDRDIGQPHNIDFVLPYANSFDDHKIAARSIKHGSSIGRGARKTTERPASSHAADINSGIAIVILHADAVAQNCTASVRAGGIYRDDADGSIFFAIEFGELIDQGTLPGSGRARPPHHSRLGAVGEERLEQIGPALLAVFYDGDGPSEGAGFAGADAFDKSW